MSATSRALALSFGLGLAVTAHAQPLPSGDEPGATQAAVESPPGAASPAPAPAPAPSTKQPAVAPAPSTKQPAVAPAPSTKPPAAAPAQAPKPSAAAPAQAPRPSAAAPAPARKPATTVVDSEPAPTVPATPPAGPAAEREKWLRAKLDEILARPTLAGAKVSIAVAEVDSGRVLYGKNDGALLNPASNVKIVTTAAALALLGPEYRWKTVLGVAPVKGGVVEGDLYLKGHGDPSLVSEDLWKLAADLAARGVKRIAGDLVVDDSFFDGERVGPGFEQKDEDLPYRSPAGAVSLNYNTCAVQVLPGAAEGAPARVVVEPATPYFVVVNDAKTVAQGRTSVTLATRELDGHTEVHVAGNVRLGDEGHVEHRRLAHPDLNAAFALRELLARRGIKIGGAVKNGVMPDGARLLATHYSAPLGVLVRDVNKHSNNFMAEQLLKTLGAELGGKPGTWQKGVDAVGRFLDGIGVPRERYKMTNGSGLYDSNRFSATQIVAILRTAYRDFRWAADFVGSLSVAGADGTIGHRMEGSPAERYVRAKTGTLAGVSCLSGYAGAPGHLPLVFSVLMNELPEAATPEARHAQDAIAEALVAFLGQ